MAIDEVEHRKKVAEEKSNYVLKIEREKGIRDPLSDFLDLDEDSDLFVK